MKPAEYTQGVDLGPGPESRLHVVPACEFRGRAGQQEMGVIRAGPCRVLRISTLQAHVGDTQRVTAFGPHHLVLELSPQVADRVAVLLVRFDGRLGSDTRQVKLELRADVRYGQDPFGIHHGGEHFLARAGMVT